MDDMYVRTFDAEECELLQQSLEICVRSLKDNGNNVNQELVHKMEQLLADKFEARV